MQTFTLTQPDDWHCHFRDGDYLNTTVPATARVFARAIVMPNLKIPVCTVTEANRYRQRILDSLPNNHAFEPLMTLYLTDMTTPGLIEEAAQSSIIKACKLYPAGATTNSSLGVTQLKKIYPALESMEKNQLPLLIHGEVTDDEIDIFDREKRFIDDILTSVVKTFPKLPIVLEHITTKDAVQYVEAAPTNIGATITVHHLLYNRNKLLAGGIKPDFYCLPILKRQNHQQALLLAATSGNKKFFLGTDSAPHSTVSKYAACGCAGIFSAHGALELYAEVFEQQQSLDKLEAFASFHGADFYGLPRNSRKITLAKDPWQVPFRYVFGKESLTPLCSGETINWKVI